MLKKSICLFMAVTMIFSLGACKSNKEKSKTDTSDVSVGNESVVTPDTGVSDTDSTVSDSSTDTSSAGSSSAGSTNSTSNPSSSNTSSATSSVSTLSSVPKSLRGTTLNVYSWNAAKDVPGATTVINKFQKDTGITVKWKVGTYNNYKSEIAAMVAARNAPDVIRLRGVEPGLLSLLDPVSVSGYEFKENIWDSFVSDVYTINGKTYGVNRENTLLQQPLTMFYNRDLITKFDLSDPYAIWKRDKSKWNWDTFLEICNDYKKVAGVDSKPWMVNSYKDYAMTLGAYEIKRNSNGTYASNMGDSNLLLGAQKIAELRMNGIAFFGWDMNGFNNGQYLFFGPAIISARRTHFDLTDMKTKGTLGVVPYPCVKGQSTYYQNVWEIEAYGIPKGAKNAAAVPYFLSYYTDGENYDESTFFNDKRILDVYNYCMSETTLVPESDRYILHMDLGGSSYLEYLEKLETATPAQIPQIFNTYAPIIENAVKEANNILAGDVG